MKMRRLVTVTQFSTRRLQPDEACQLIATIAESLHYAHQRGLVHRDVKPGNNLIGADNKPYLVDFGLARRDDKFRTGPVGQFVAARNEVLPTGTRLSGGLAAELADAQTTGDPARAGGIAAGIEQRT